MVTMNRMTFSEIVAVTRRPVVVFGASAIGGIILDALDNILNIRPVCFGDNDVRKQSEGFRGYPVISFEKLRVDFPDALVVIAAGRYFDDIAQQLMSHGYRDIYSDADVIGCIDFKNTPRSKLGNIIWHLAKIGELAEIPELCADGFHIPRLNVVVTTRCTLKCIHCSSLIPHYEKPADIDSSTIMASLDRLFAEVDMIYHVELLGGEPFLYKNLPAIAHHLLDSGKILHIDVITNGTLLPEKSVLEALKHPSLSVVIDDYGRLSKKKDALACVLKQLGIDYRINQHWAWADLGGFEPRRRSAGQLSELFSTCHFNSCTELIDGILYRCPRSSHGTRTGLVPEYERDTVDLLEPIRRSEDIREILRTFFNDKPFIRACDHCNGNTCHSLTLAPAEQKAFGEKTG